MSSTLSGDALNAMIKTSTGPTPVCIYDLAVKVFGKQRVANFNRDPEVAAFIEELYEMVDQSWAEKGVSEELGPYLE